MFSPCELARMCKNVWFFVHLLASIVISCERLLCEGIPYVINSSFSYGVFNGSSRSHGETLGNLKHILLSVRPLCDGDREDFGALFAGLSTGQRKAQLGVPRRVRACACVCMGVGVGRAGSPPAGAIQNTRGYFGSNFLLVAMATERQP